MLQTQPTPIIFLAFANDRADGIGYLRNLPDEARRVHAALEPVRAAGLCEVIVRQNATLADILAVFQYTDYRNRIALFHYAGHANGYQLLLEDNAGYSAQADAGGLADFLAQQRGLEIVFLNGCSTQPQVQGLLDAGISAVIATAQAIDDAVATRFAECFYQSLAGSGTLQRAYNEAAATLRTMYGNETRHFYLKGSAGEHTATPAQHSRLPWSLYRRAGAEIIDAWSLPQAANDPLFGLPTLPALDLPATPFRHLAWFRRDDAPIFFGRGYQIRELYNRVTDAAGAPLILFYGQSGVGKSSLLAAGLLPRLEATHTVRYERRNREEGILGALAAAFGLSAAESTADQLCAAWLALEAEDQQPVVVLLDQVEEIYTRPNPARPDELAAFLAVLQILLGERRNRPQGKLVLAFRKEWLAEIDKHVGEAKLSRAPIFLERLNRAGIIEAIEGITRDQRLQAYYGLTVETGLAGEIADDLLVDRGASVAPTLQILLSKLWERARARNYSTPCFDQDLYHELRHQGLLLRDFLDQQLVGLHARHPAAVDLGLALDLLAFHTTPLGTAEQRTLVELRDLYRHQDDTLLALLRTCQDLYLLTDPSADQPANAPASRLAHDTLAPLVRARFDESDAPGQRARRILETRAVDWADQKVGTPLDQTDLTLVESGRLGMRVWTEREMRLLEASRIEQQRREAERTALLQEQEAARQRELELAQQMATTESARAQAQTLAAQRLRWMLMVSSGLIVALFLVGGILVLPTLQEWRAIRSARGELVMIDAGIAVIGTDLDSAEPAEKPLWRPTIAAFKIEKYEVSNAQYRLCIEHGGCSDTSNPLEVYDEARADHPIRFLTAVQAAAYCRWIGRRLPTELEWEYTARGTTGRTWPWGEEVTSDEHRCMVKSDTCSVTSHPEGSTPDGVYHLWGNVWEWTSSYFQETYENYDASFTWSGEATTLIEDPRFVLRGGSSWAQAPTVTYRLIVPAYQSYDDYGVRCVEE